jgi:hypothetical protein
LVTGVHAPVPITHAVHAPVHVADEQQKPSLHSPVEQPMLAVHAPPAAAIAVHAPDELQKLVPVQVSGSWTFVSGVHAPVPAAHAVHAPLHVDDEQQNPSLHTPDVHCALTVHAAPAAVCATQLPAALQ